MIGIYLPIDRYIMTLISRDQSVDSLSLEIYRSLHFYKLENQRNSQNKSRSEYIPICRYIMMLISGDQSSDFPTLRNIQILTFLRVRE